MDSPTAYLLALEGGGTRSQAALLDSSGNVLHLSQSGPVNTNFVPFAAARQAALAAVETVLASSGLAPASVLHFASALVGPRFGPETFNAILPQARYSFYDERAVVFARAGLYQPHGVAVVAATGATAWGLRADDGRAVALGGWGSLLGDEGSAYAAGLLGLRAAVRVYEQRDPTPTRLLAAVCQHFELTEANFHPGLVQLAYQKPLSRTEIASLAPVVTRLAAEGDPLAARLTAKVAADLAALALHAARRLFAPAEIFSVAAAGGLLNAGPLLLAPLETRLAAEFSHARLLIGTIQPAIALGRLALFDLQENPC